MLGSFLSTVQRLAAPASTNLVDEHRERLFGYYASLESRLYYAFLRGTKHYGFYRPGDPGWNVWAAMRRMEDYLGALLDLPAGSTVLDAGCGIGDVAARLATRLGLDVTGIDIRPDEVAAARRRAQDRGLRTHFEEMDYTQLTLPEQAFDGAYMVETLVHSSDVEAVLRGLHRVLRPGGRLVMLEYSRTAPDSTSEHEERFMTIVNEGAAMPAFQLLEHGLLEQLLERTGFVDVTAEDLTEHMMPMLRIFALAGWLPYRIAQALGQPQAVVNSMAGVEFYRHRDCWRYNAYTCRKPT